MNDHEMLQYLRQETARRYQIAQLESQDAHEKSNLTNYAAYWGGIAVTNLAINKIIHNHLEHGKEPTQQ